MADIYGHHRIFMKAPIYDTFGRPGIFNMRDPGEHRERRRLLRPVFSQSALNDTETLIAAHVQKLVGRFLEQGDRVGGVDVFYWFRSVADSLHFAANS